MPKVAMIEIPLKQYWNLFFDYLKPQWGRVTLLAIALLSSIGLQVINPQVLRYFIDTAVAGGSQQSLLTAAILFTVLALLSQVLAVAATYWGENAAWTATNALRVDLAVHCLNLDLSFHKSRTPGELIERIDGDTTALAKFFSQLIIYVLGNLLLLLGVLIALFWLDWRAGLCLAIYSITALIVLVRIRIYSIVYWAANRQVSAEFFGFLGEQFTGREDIRANGAVSYAMNRFYKILQRWLPVFHKARLIGTILWGTSIGLFAVGNAIALSLGAYLWSQGAIAIGTVYLIFHYTNLLRQPMEQIRTQLEELQQAEASIYRIRELFQIQSKLNTTGNKLLPTNPLSISFEEVWFSYEIEKPNQEREFDISDEWTLQDITFYLRPGEVLGLLGRTGSGKTTLARLLLRLYEPQTGSIRLGGVPINETRSTEISQHIGLVTQDVQLFQATIRDNLTFFDRNFSDDHLLQALETLGLTEWLQSLPQGLDTQLGADSNGLSAGEAQLLALARIFLKNPGLVILDEASSRLDPITEKRIERAIDKLLDGRTGVIIAHRLQTIQRADKILILEKGQIIEYGDRKQLANNPNTRFAQLLKTGLTEILV
ncbi:MAG TPA: ABC transporter ATP-binding protein [Leptolyngbyaceae cyanobacterium]